MAVAIGCVSGQLRRYDRGELARLEDASYYRSIASA
jgi:hypothetical protein